MRHLNPNVSHQFQLEYTANNNYRVLVDGQIHPLMCGLVTREAAVARVEQLYNVHVVKWNRMIWKSDTLLHVSGEVAARVNMIELLEGLIAEIKATPEADINKFELNARLELYSKKAGE